MQRSNQCVELEETSEQAVRLSPEINVIVISRRCAFSGRQQHVKRAAVRGVRHRGLRTGHEHKAVTGELGSSVTSVPGRESDEQRRIIGGSRGEARES
jgi:hypothetical protein